tara:strand:+ start:24 stop:455 length:432 start_codon:yes stop_codon:yes gene_type:complete
MSLSVILRDNRQLAKHKDPNMADDFTLVTHEQASMESFEWGELHWYAAGELSHSTGLTVGRCILKSKCSNPIHYHPNCEEVLHVLGGSIEHYIDGKGWFVMNTGDSITIPKDIKHGARNIGDGEAHLLIAFSSAHRQTIGESQ